MKNLIKKVWTAFILLLIFISMISSVYGMSARPTPPRPTQARREIKIE